MKKMSRQEVLAVEHVIECCNTVIESCENMQRADAMHEDRCIGECQDAAEALVKACQEATSHVENYLKAAQDPYEVEVNKKCLAACKKAMKVAGECVNACKNAERARIDACCEELIEAADECLEACEESVDECGF